MQQDKNKKQQIRWYDRDDIVIATMEILEHLPDKQKRQVATFLIDEIITKKPYVDMFPSDTHHLVISEDRRRRWYDFDETVRIFIELLRHTSDDQKKEICHTAYNFINSMPKP